MNPFTLLEVPPDASPETIKAAYHRLAKTWHPDRFSGPEKAEAELRFRALAEAFTLLKDPARRALAAQQAPPVEAPPIPAQSAPPSPPPPAERTALDWADMAKAALEGGQLEQARGLVHYAIQMDGSNAGFYTLLAAILEREGSGLRAVVKALEMAVQLDPRDVESHLKLAAHFQSIGLEARAQRHWALARELSPGHPKIKQTGLGAGESPRPSGAFQGQPGMVPDRLLDQAKGLWGRLTGKR